MPGNRPSGDSLASSLRELDGRGARGSFAILSIAYRNAASVLPEPVGAEIRTCSPEAIAGHAWACAGVGSAKALLNHSRVVGLKFSRGTVLPA